MAEAALHEDLGRKQEGQGGSDRSFGIVFAVFFTLLALLPLRAHRPVRGWALAVAALFLGVGLLRPGWLHPLNRAWTKLGLLLGRVVSPIVTGIVFFLVVTPIALIFRMLKKDPLRLAPGGDAQTYWIVRQPPGPAPESMRHQF